MRRNGRSQIALLALMAVVYSPERATFGRRLSVPIKTAVSCRATVLADSEQALPKWPKFCNFRPGVTRALPLFFRNASSMGVADERWALHATTAWIA